MTGGDGRARSLGLACLAATFDKLCHARGVGCTFAACHSCSLSLLLTCKNLSCRSGESPAMNHSLCQSWSCPDCETGFSALHLRLASAPRYNMRRDLVVILQLVERLHDGSRRKILFHHDFAELAVLLILLWHSQNLKAHAPAPSTSPTQSSCGMVLVGLVRGCFLRRDRLCDGMLCAPSTFLLICRASPCAPKKHAPWHRSGISGSVLTGNVSRNLEHCRCLRQCSSICCVKFTLLVSFFTCQTQRQPCVTPLRLFSVSR